VAACDPNLGAFAARIEQLRFAARGVKTFGDYTQMLDGCRGGLDVVTIPTRFPCTRPCTARASSGNPRLPGEAPHPGRSRAGADARRRGGGVQGHPGRVQLHRRALRQQLKGRIAAGEFGPAKLATLLNLSPRATSYYTRADWAGRLMLNGRLVLDTAMGNARAHNVHNMLFWCGQGDPWAWTRPPRCRPRCTRPRHRGGRHVVRPRAGWPAAPSCESSPATPAPSRAGIAETVACRDATASYLLGWPQADGSRYNGMELRPAGGEPTRWAMTHRHLQENLLLYFRYVRGDARGQ